MGVRSGIYEEFYIHHLLLLRISDHEKCDIDHSSDNLLHVAISKFGGVFFLFGARTMFCIGWVRRRLRRRDGPRVETTIFSRAGLYYVYLVVADPCYNIDLP